MVLNRVSQCLRFLAFLGFASFSSYLHAQAPSPAPSLEWRDFKSDAGRFLITFPGPPEIKELRAQRGPVTLSRHAHVLAVSGFVFHTEYIDYPPGYSDPSLSLEGGISGFKHSIQGDGGSLLNEGPISRGTCEGREATFLFQPKRPNHPQFWHGRIFASGQRYYLMMFTADEDSPAAREVGRKFLESFSVIGGCSSMIAPVAAPSAPAKVEVVNGSLDPVTGWRRIDSPLGFAVLMPGAATHETEQTQIEPFPITHHTFSHETESSIFSVEVFGEYPTGFHSTDVHFKATLDLMLAGVKRNLEPAGFTIAPLRELSLGRFPGREFSLSHKELGTGRMQIYVTPTYIYVFISVGNNSAARSNVVNRFFESLRISPK